MLWNLLKSSRHTRPRQLPLPHTVGIVRPFTERHRPASSPLTCWPCPQTKQSLAFNACYLNQFESIVPNFGYGSESKLPHLESESPSEMNGHFGMKDEMILECPRGKRYSRNDAQLLFTISRSNQFNLSPILQVVDQHRLDLWYAPATSHHLNLQSLWIHWSITHMTHVSYTCIEREGSLTSFQKKAPTTSKSSTLLLAMRNATLADRFMGKTISTDHTHLAYDGLLEQKPQSQMPMHL